MDLLHKLLGRFYTQLPPTPRKAEAPVPIYTIDIGEEAREFEAFHMQYANPLRDPEATQEYVASLVEQMVAHFEYQNTAVQSFIAHYTTLITEGVSPHYIYHPLRFLRVMSNDEYQRYVYCLYGFAETMYRLFVQHGLFNEHGRLIASYQGFQYGVLYLIVRPEVPNVFAY